MPNTIILDSHSPQKHLCEPVLVKLVHSTPSCHHIIILSSGERVNIIMKVFDVVLLLKIQSRQDIEPSGSNILCCIRKSVVKNLNQDIAKKKKKPNHVGNM